MQEIAGIGTSLPGWHRFRQCFHLEIEESSAFAPFLLQFKPFGGIASPSNRRGYAAKSPCLCVSVVNAFSHFFGQRIPDVMVVKKLIFQHNVCITRQKESPCSRTS